jgi:hypothetical protein
MGKMMPLKWIEQAEARRVCVIALSETAPALNLPNVAMLLTGSVRGMRAWFTGADRDRDNDTAPLDRVVRLRRVRRAAG